MRTVPWMVWLLTLSLSSALAAESFTYWKDGAPEEIEIVQFNAFRVDLKCSKAPGTCKALGAYKLKPTLAIPKQPGLLGHPASDHCEATGGSVAILTDSRLNQRNYCEFPDGTLVDSWDLLDAFKYESRSQLKAERKVSK